MLNLSRPCRVAKRAGVSLALSSVLLVTLSVSTTLAAGPQVLADEACNAGTLNASDQAPNRTSSEAIAHIEHAAFLPIVPYCHHFNPTASPPPGFELTPEPGRG